MYYAELKIHTMQALSLQNIFKASSHKMHCMPYDHLQKRKHQWHPALKMKKHYVLHYRFVLYHGNNGSMQHAMLVVSSTHSNGRHIASSYSLEPRITSTVVSIFEKIISLRSTQNWHMRLKMYGLNAWSVLSHKSQLKKPTTILVFAAIL